MTAVSGRLVRIRWSCRKRNRMAALVGRTELNTSPAITMQSGFWTRMSSTARRNASATSASPWWDPRGVSRSYWRKPRWRSERWASFMASWEERLAPFQTDDAAHGPKTSHGHDGRLPLDLALGAQAHGRASPYREHFVGRLLSTHVDRVAEARRRDGTIELHIHPQGHEGIPVDYLNILNGPFDGRVNGTLGNAEVWNLDATAAHRPPVAHLDRVGGQGGGAEEHRAATQLHREACGEGVQAAP